MTGALLLFEGGGEGEGRGGGKRRDFGGGGVKERKIATREETAEKNHPYVHFSLSLSSRHNFSCLSHTYPHRHVGEQSSFLPLFSSERKQLRRRKYFRIADIIGINISQSIIARKTLAKPRKEDWSGGVVWWSESRR
jgi:hypothetical protein